MTYIMNTTYDSQRLNRSACEPVLMTGYKNLPVVYILPTFTSRSRICNALFGMFILRQHFTCILVHCRAYIFPVVINVTIDVSAHAQ